MVVNHFVARLSTSSISISRDMGASSAPIGRVEPVHTHHVVSVWALTPARPCVGSARGVRGSCAGVPDGGGGGPGHSLTHPFLTRTPSPPSHHPTHLRGWNWRVSDMLAYRRYGALRQRARACRAVTGKKLMPSDLRKRCYSEVFTLSFWMSGCLRGLVIMRGVFGSPDERSL